MKVGDWVVTDFGHNPTIPVIAQIEKIHLSSNPEVHGDCYAVRTLDSINAIHLGPIILMRYINDKVFTEDRLILITQIPYKELGIYLSQMDFSSGQKLVELLGLKPSLPSMSKV